MAHTDPALKDILPQAAYWGYGMGVLGAAGVYLMGMVLKKRAQTAA